MPTITTEDTTQTQNPTSATASFEFTLKPWQQDDEFARFEALTKKLVNTPKSAERVTQ